MKKEIEKEEKFIIIELTRDEIRDELKKNMENITSNIKKLMAEKITYSKVLSSAEITIVENYFTLKINL